MADLGLAAQQLVKPGRPAAKAPRVAVMVGQDRAPDPLARRNAEQPHAELDDDIELQVAYAIEHIVGEPFPRALFLGLESHRFRNRQIGRNGRRSSLRVADREEVQRIISGMGGAARLRPVIGAIEDDEAVSVGDGSKRV